MSPRWRNVFFDLDGTLVDTIKLIVDSHLHSLVEVIGPDHGYEEAEIRTWIGTPIMTVFERIVPGRAQLMNDSYVAWNEANTAAYIGVYPGMKELLADLAAAGVQTGVVTSKRRAPVNLALELTDLTADVPFFVAADDVTEHKPLPEPLFKAMAHVGGTPADSVYIGDAVLDIQAAHNAGLPGVAVTWGASTGGQLAAADPEFTVATADELRELLLPGGGTMRVARYVAPGRDPAFGLVELAEDGGEHPGTIAAITGDPLAGGRVDYTGERVHLADVRVVAPVLPRSKVVGIGRNYAAHIEEMKQLRVDHAAPDEILTFYKPNTAVIGPDEPIIHPAAATELSYEGELAVVIGRICRSVPVERAGDVIFGYTVGNDVTARDWQRSDGQWSRAKGSDTFCPLGPWIVTHLTPADITDLPIRTTLDGEVRQDGLTALMLRSVPELVSYVTSFTTLLPGDVILTGTPAGVGLMQPGQRVEVTIEGIGTLANPVLAEEAE